MCTTIGVDPGATIDKSSLVTSNADCADCDFRLAKTPPKKHELPALRPIYKYRNVYPRMVAEERGSTWSASNLQGPFKDTYTSDAFKTEQLLGYIPEVESTFGLFESLFGMMNDQQVSIGESTCAARYGATSFPRKCLDCAGPLMDVAALSLVALERCATARCAVQMMGDLAMQHGYYPAENIEDERGEALTVGDGTEVWVFHILPDDKGAAVWVAQRIPTGHVAVAANAFVIRGVDPHSPDFLYSPNLWELAVANNVAKYDDDGYLDFTVTYGPDEFTAGESGMKKPEYCTDRVWRVFSLVAPSLNLSRDVNFFGDGLPFSVAAERPLTVADMMAINRDHYEGSALDLTKGFAAGPYGNPIRYDEGSARKNNLTNWDVSHGAFPRAIAIMRTSWHYVAQSRPQLPNEVGGILWYSQYQPSAGAYAPLYVSMNEAPST
jgi:dipeptidase